MRPFSMTILMAPLLKHKHIQNQSIALGQFTDHLVIFRTQNVIFLLIGRSLNASQIQQEMRQGIGHETLVFSLAYLAVDIAVVPDIFWRTVYPERNFKLIVSQRPVDFCRRQRRRFTTSAAVSS